LKRWKKEVNIFLFYDVCRFTYPLLFRIVEKEEIAENQKGIKATKVDIDLCDDQSEPEGYFKEDKLNVGCFLHLDSLRMHPTQTIVANLSKYLMNEKKAKDQSKIKKEEEAGDALKVSSSALASSSSSSSSSISSLQSEEVTTQSPTIVHCTALINSDDDVKEKKTPKTFSRLKTSLSTTKLKPITPKKDVDFVKCNVITFSSHFILTYHL
jgi:hypothetical protein